MIDRPADPTDATARAIAPVRARAAGRDRLTPAIVVIALVLFVATGGEVGRMVVARYHGGDEPVEVLMATALLLNIALLLFAWRRQIALTTQTIERVALERQALHLATRDPLTGLHNRRALGDLAAVALAQAARRGRPTAVLMIDLDKFKAVNDLHGHATGDRVLIAAAARIVEALPDGAVAARLGGDEFACAFSFDPAFPANPSHVADRLVAALAEAFVIDGATANVSASIGLARSDTDGDTIERLLRCADIAMYDAKKAGRNRRGWFDRGMEERLQARLDIERGLRHAIPNGQIVPYYEKQVDLGTGALMGFEVLARWEHPTQGVIPPDLFIAVAEEGGLISDLSISVMRAAFEQARGWDPALTLSINVAPMQLKDPWFAQKVVKLLTETGFPARRLELEITESSLFENLGLAQSIIGSLKNQGIRIALDDFGTGYSSLAHLRALPFDRIKIDKSFVMAMEGDPESAAIVDAITRLGASLNLPITAEGVATLAIEQRLIALGCLKGQGYRYGKPMHVRQVRAMLATQAQLVVGRNDDPDGVNMLRQAS